MLLWMGLATGPAVAQSTAPPIIPYDARVDSLFREGVRLYEEQQYEQAFDVFTEVYEGQTLNRRTTAALVMAGKTLYAQGEYEQAIEALEDFTDRFSESTYVGAAEETIALAQDMLERDPGSRIYTLGIMFPMEQGGFTQSLFNGIRMAVDAYNDSEPERPVRMVFRDSGGDVESARDAAQDLVNEQDVNGIIGPLYSEEALAASRVADAAEVLMIVPLATDGNVSERMRYVYQANPTFRMSGRLMARYAMDRLRLTRFGTVAEADTDAMDYVEGFREEVREQGGEVRLDVRLPEAGAWFQLPAYLTRDTLTSVDALYIPVTGGAAQERIEAALNGIDQASTGIRLLGNGEWNDLPGADRLSRHLTIFTDNFQADPGDPAVAAFDRDYERWMNRAPDHLAYVGYDVAQFLLQKLGAVSSGQDAAGTDALREAFQEGDPFRGLITTIDFRNGNVNQAISFREYTNGQIVTRE